MSMINIKHSYLSYFQTGGYIKSISTSVIIVLSIILMQMSACQLLEPDPDDPIILAASISEQPPINYQVEGRKVILSIELTKLPDCTKDNSQWQYGFLIDADRDSTTGIKDATFSDLGIDAKILISCNSDLGEFVSNIGSVSIQPNINGTTISIETTVDSLPSVNFFFIAFAHNGTEFYRLPESSAASWAINEIRRY